MALCLGQGSPFHHKTCNSKPTSIVSITDDKIPCMANPREKAKGDYCIQQ